MGMKGALTALFGVLTAVWGTLGWLVVIWVGCMALDYLSGSWAAKRAGQWTSAAAREGLAGKGGMILFVLGATVLDFLLMLALAHLPAQLPFSYNLPICALVLCWYILTETGSIFENAEKMGAHWPPFLRKVLQMLRQTVQSTGEGMAAGDDEKQDEEKKKKGL